MTTSLVRERSRVQFSPAAPGLPKYMNTKNNLVFGSGARRSVYSPDLGALGSTSRTCFSEICEAISRLSNHRETTHLYPTHVDFMLRRSSLKKISTSGQRICPARKT
jgi:hypothetical protein